MTHRQLHKWWRYLSFRLALFIISTVERTITAIQLSLIEMSTDGLPGELSEAGKREMVRISLIIIIVMTYVIRLKQLTI